MRKSKLISFIVSLAIVLSVCSFSIPSVFASTTGKLIVSGNLANSCNIYLNGNYINSYIPDVVASTFDLTLQPGKNALVIVHHSIGNICSTNKNKAGIIADLEVDGVHHVSGSNWKATCDGWPSTYSQPDYDASSWSYAWNWNNSELPYPVDGFPAGSTANWMFYDSTGGFFAPSDRIFRYEFNVEGEATPTTTPTTTSTATPTETATATPTATPSATPVIPSFKVESYNTNTTQSSNTIYERFRVTNTGTGTLDLSQIKLRYHFTQDVSSTPVFNCDWATAGSSNINGAFFSNNKTNADKYCEVSFTGTAGTLAPGASTEIVLRITNSDWSNFTQTNDYSFNSSAYTYVEYNHITAYYSNTLAYGIEPQ
ncbi:cellulose binding domain-containing protein [Acetivibrio cellulolyticus]|uniref:cellulose binding domain-containing protein n=1 Tax=Acetivibrio cellulolyticus TaxID=35830 RepID=UPI0001E2FAD9|nr:cellulose binding domain-containing protein [Acetivibrio cellulolyticus]